MPGRPSSERPADRGQAHVLEGIVGAILVVTSVIFALQVTAVTPLTASTANQHLQSQNSGVAADLLASADHRGTLGETIRYWNDSAGRFHDAGENGIYQASIPTTFGRTLENEFGGSGLVYNVDVWYLNGERQTRQLTVLEQGTPSDHAVTVTRTVVLYDSDRLLTADETQSARTLADANRYPIPDVESGPVFNVLRVEVVVWRV